MGLPQNSTYYRNNSETRFREVFRRFREVFRRRRRVLTNFCVPRGPRFGGAVRRGPPWHAKIDFVSARANLSRKYSNNSFSWFCHRRFAIHLVGFGGFCNSFNGLSEKIELEFDCMSAEFATKFLRSN